MKVKYAVPLLTVVMTSPDPRNCELTPGFKTTPDGCICIADWAYESEDSCVCLDAYTMSDNKCISIDEEVPLLKATT